MRRVEVLEMLAPLAVLDGGSLGHGSRPDYGTGPHLALMASAVRLARRDLRDPELRDGAREFLDGDLVALFADCIGYGGRL